MAINFDASDDIVNCGTSSSLENLELQNGGGLTISAWIRPLSAGEGGFGQIVSKANSAVARSIEFAMLSTTGIYFAHYTSATPVERDSSNSFVTANAWNHVLVTWDGTLTATGIKLYANGTEEDSYAVTQNGTGAANTDVSYSLVIGGMLTDVSFHFDGPITEVGVWNRVLSKGEINLLSKSRVSGTPLQLDKKGSGLDSQTVLLLHCNGADGTSNFLDSSSSHKTITTAGNCQMDTAQFKFGGSSAYFDGTGDYLTAADSDDWNFSTGDFTVDLWWRLDVLNIGVTNSIIGQYGGAGNLGWIWDYSLLSGGSRFFWTTDGVSGGSTLFTWAPSADTWYHLELVRNGTSIIFFVDGSQVGTSGLIGTSNIFNSTNVLGIGIYEGGGVPINPHNGWMDEIRISKGIAINTSNFTVPIEEYAIENSLRGYWPLNDFPNLATASGNLTIRDRSRNSNHGTPSGGPISKSEQVLSYQPY